MLDIKWIRENPKALVQALLKRNQPSSVAESTVERILELDEARRAHLGELQTKQERRNAASREIGNAMRAKDMALADTLKAEVNDRIGRFALRSAATLHLPAIYRDPSNEYDICDVRGKICF